MTKLKKLAVKKKRILKKQPTVTVNLPAYKAPRVLGDENRFFKSQMEETKRSMFFS